MLPICRENVFYLLRFLNCFVLILDCMVVAVFSTLRTERRFFVPSSVEGEDGRLARVTREKYLRVLFFFFFDHVAIFFFFRFCNSQHYRDKLRG